jgi:hypothetical protein
LGWQWLGVAVGGVAAAVVSGTVAVVWVAVAGWQWLVAQWQWHSGGGTVAVVSGWGGSGWGVEWMGG